MKVKFGNVKCSKVTLRDTLKARFLRFIANADGLWWMLRNRR